MRRKKEVSLREPQWESRVPKPELGDVPAGSFEAMAEAVLEGFDVVAYTDTGIKALFLSGRLPYRQAVLVDRWPDYPAVACGFVASPFETIATWMSQGYVYLPLCQLRFNPLDWEAIEIPTGAVRPEMIARSGVSPLLPLFRIPNLTMSERLVTTCQLCGKIVTP